MTRSQRSRMQSKNRYSARRCLRWEAQSLTVGADSTHSVILLPESACDEFLYNYRGGHGHTHNQKENSGTASKLCRFPVVLTLRSHAICERSPLFSDTPGTPILANTGVFGRGYLSLVK
jgi:hypothetical protein